MYFIVVNGEYIFVDLICVVNVILIGRWEIRSYLGYVGIVFYLCFNLRDCKKIIIFKFIFYIYMMNMY